MIAIDDWRAINELYARQCWANDSGDVDAYVATFTSDAVIAGSPPIDGRAALHHWFADRVAARANEPHDNAQHWVGNLVVDGTATAASAQCYVQRSARSTATGKVEILVQVRYHDELEKNAEGWRIKRRAIGRG